MADAAAGGGAAAAPAGSAEKRAEEVGGLEEVGQRTVRFVCCGNLFEIDSRYKPLKPIGRGAYGVVVSAVDSFTGRRVAIKRISNAFNNNVDARRTLREVVLLRCLRHENVIELKDLMRPPGTSPLFNHLYVVYELMDTDLHQVIRSSQPLSPDHLAYILYQILRGLKYIHSANVLHRDLKPSNLLLNANCDLKICDFGLARTGSERELMSEYVVTRWYRAPELLLSCTEYCSAIDVWSVGCIFAEMMARRPIFPGKDYIHQLNLITRLMGSPDPTQLAWVQSEKARRYLISLPQCPPSDFTLLFPRASEAALEVMVGMLAFSPSQRLRVEDVLGHAYLASLSDPSDEPTACPFAFPFDDASPLGEDGLRELVEKECAFYAHLREEQPPTEAGGVENAAWREQAAGGENRAGAVVEAH